MAICSVCGYSATTIFYYGGQGLPVCHAHDPIDNPGGCYDEIIRLRAERSRMVRLLVKVLDGKPVYEDEIRALIGQEPRITDEGSDR